MNRTKPVLTLKRPHRAAKRSKPSGPPAQATELPPRRVSDDELLCELRSVAPDLWHDEAPVPLAIGIHKQLYPIAERLRMSRRALRDFLSRWTAARAYQQALVEPGAKRFNLDGSEADEVSDQHREDARQRLTPH